MEIIKEKNEDGDIIKVIEKYTENEICYKAKISLAINFIWDSVVIGSVYFIYLMV